MRGGGGHIRRLLDAFAHCPSAYSGAANVPFIELALSQSPASAQDLGAYVLTARAAHAAGLNPLPIKPGAKAPMVKWKAWQDCRLPAGIVDSWCSRFSEANLGTTTGGITGLLTVDVDTQDPAVWQDCIDRFGDTPAKVLTASGKLHLHYQSPGGVRNAQRLDGAPVDIRGDGGFIVLPPSIRPDHGAYTWLEGDLEALQRLPLPLAGALLSATPKVSRCLSKAPQEDAGSTTGTRNRDLFNHLRSVALTCASEADLVKLAQAWNRTLVEPLPDAEVRQTTGSVWRLREEDRLLVPGCASTVLVPAAVVEQLAMSEPHAIALYIHLRRLHHGRRDAFAISIHAMAPAIAWTERRLRDTRRTLLDRGLLIEVHRGGKRDGDASLFRFAELH